MQKAIHCVISGRVQMVMYRDFATRTATKMNIVGCVQNISDGSVDLVAEGEENALLMYIEALKKGSLLSHVEQVDVHWQVAEGEYSTFDIVY